MLYILHVPTHNMKLLISKLYMRVIFKGKNWAAFVNSEWILDLLIAHTIS
jgi:hypothetical protein